MAVLLHLFLILVAGASPQIVALNTPGAMRANVVALRHTYSLEAPAFRGVVYWNSNVERYAFDCSFLPVWDGESIYPCWPASVDLAPAGQVELFADGAPGTRVAVEVFVYGYPPVVYLPFVAN